MSWTSEKEKIYQASLNRLKLHKEELKEEKSNWKTYPEAEYVSVYSPNTLNDYKTLFSVIDRQYEEYLTPILVSIMKNKRLNRKQTSEKDLLEQESLVPEYRYNF